jgi:hypothetical protein
MIKPSLKHSTLTVFITFYHISGVLSRLHYVIHKQKKRVPSRHSLTCLTPHVNLLVHHRMNKKRARTRGGSKLSSKRVKVEPGRNLLDLPPEVIDIILGSAINIPNKNYHATGGAISIAKAFGAPIAHTCRQLRQLSLDLIQAKCFWIRIEINSRDGVETFEEETADFLPIVPALFWSQFRRPPPTFELVVGDTELPGAKLRVTRRYNPASTSFVFPYNFDSFNRVCQWIRRVAVQQCLKSLLVRYDPQIKPPHELFTSRIIPTLLTIRKLKTVRFEIPDDLKPSDEIAAQMLDTPRRASDLLKDAQTAVQLANDYQAEGQTADAGLKLLYSLWIYLQANKYLPEPEQWNDGETDEDPLVLAWTNLRARNAIGNKLRQTIHEIEYRACLAYRDLFENYGFPWLMTHLHIFGKEHGRWVDEPYYTWFGLSSAELAQVHHARAIAHRIDGALEDMLTGAPRVVRTTDSDGNVVHKPRYNDDAYELVAEEMYFATWLQPDNLEYRRLYKTVDPGDEEELMDFEEMLSERKYETVGLEPIASWKGDEDMLYGWGGPEVLQFLPLARKGLQQWET